VYDDGVCSYRIESYWLYELCHGRYVLQYHDDKETKSRTEYFLGNYAKVSADAVGCFTLLIFFIFMGKRVCGLILSFVQEAKTFDQLNPPTRKIGEETLPYYPVLLLPLIIVA
jgi:hypothetical protein